MNNSIQDAANYVLALKAISEGADTKSTIDAYDQEMLERGKREIEISIPAAIATHDVELFGDGPLARIGVGKPVEKGGESRL